MLGLTIFAAVIGLGMNVAGGGLQAPENPVVEAKEFTIPVDNNVQVSGARWQRGGETIIVFTVREISGRTAVCGAVMSTGGRAGNSHIRLMKGGNVRAGGRSVMNNLTYFTPVASREDFPNADLTCRYSRRAWQDSFAGEQELRFTQRNFEY